jgi:hypothetical protein
MIRVSKTTATSVVVGFVAATAVMSAMAGRATPPSTSSAPSAVPFLFRCQPNVNIRISNALIGLDKTVDILSSKKDAKDEQSQHDETIEV